MKKMKFNMGNFPLKVNQQGIDVTLLTIETKKLDLAEKKILAIAEWKVSFEKELRELLDSYDTGWAKTEDLKKEIFGE